MTILDTAIPTGKFIARIDETRCIGCTLCIKACPFDAIVGAPKHMHTVITQFCTGCELCLPPCPVDCIDLEENSEFKKAHNSFSKDKLRELKISFAKISRNKMKLRALRIENIKKEKQLLFENRKQELLKR